MIRFRVNTLLWDMATSPKYLEPLGFFRKRIAYANAFQTDFPVPTETATFLHSMSQYPHHKISKHHDNKIISSFKTEKKNNTNIFSCSEERSAKDKIMADLEIMSRSLDSLGWTKTFVDLRSEIPLSINLSKVKSRFVQRKRS